MRIAFAIHSLNTYAWHNRIVQAVKAQDFVSEVSFVITNNEFKSWSWVYGLLSKIDKKIYHLNPNSFETQMIDVGTSNVIDLSPTKQKLIHVTTDQLQTLKGLNLDLLIDLNPRSFEQAFYSLPKFGVWEFVFGKDGFGGIQEVVQSEHVTELSLITNPKGNFGNKLLYTSFSSTEKYSYRKNIDNLNWKCASILIRAIKSLCLEKHESYFDSKATYNKYIQKEKPSLSYAFDAFQKQSRKIYTKFLEKRKYHLQWYLLIKEKSQGAFTKLFPPKGAIWADPFIMEYNGSIYVFIEEMVSGNPKGFISVIQLDKAFNIVEHHKEIIKRPYHLSYPCIFEVDGKLYMIPESYEANVVQLFECVEFPHKWKFKKNLLEDVVGFDATPLYEGGKWFLFLNQMEHPGDTHSDELFIYSTDDILNPNWESHSQNPVVVDVRKARPAGHYFRRGSDLLRPAQAGSVEYGYAVVINKVIQLSEAFYQEEMIEKIDPEVEKDILRRHTYNESEHYIIQDALKLERRS
ncbi:MAG: hypothetical protein AAGK97_09825 [Bacteroidota bacterium]